MKIKLSQKLKSIYDFLCMIEEYREKNMEKSGWGKL